MRDDRIMHRGDMLHRAIHKKGGPIPTEAQVEAWIARKLAERGLKVKPTGSKAVMVNDSRWVIECECGAGLACSPNVPHTTCPECGRQYDLDWPDEATRARIEKTLLERPPRLPRNVDAKGIITARCWNPGQKIDELEAETEQCKALHRLAKGVK